MPHVAVVHGDDRRMNVRSVLNALPAQDFEKLGSAKRILVKPNLVHHTNQLASSHVDAVRGVLDVLRVKTKAPIVVADASYHGTKAAFRNFGYEHLPEEYEGVTLVDLNDDETVPGYYIRKDGSRGEMGFAKTVVECDFRISLTQMKTHRDAGVTLSVKNWIGTWVPPARFGLYGKYWPRWPSLHQQGPRAHHESMAELITQQRIDLGIIDGFLAMEGDGPTRGSPVPMHVALAGSDPVAVDATACRLMRINPAEIGYLAMAAQRGYGVMEENAIELLGERDLGPFSRSFVLPDTWENVMDWKQ